MIPNIGGALAALYSDRCDIYRVPKGGTDPDGAVIADAQPVAVETLCDIPCRLSLGQKDSPRMAGDSNPSEVTPTLFCAPLHDLRSGDYAVVRRQTAPGREPDLYSGYIGRPSRYTGSLQCLLLDRRES